MTESEFYQLWCHYEFREDEHREWVMEGLYRHREDAEEAINKLRADAKTPCMPDWAVIGVRGWW